MSIRWNNPILGFAVAGALALTMTTAHAQKDVTRYTAFAVDMTGLMGGTSATLDIVINRWATDAENTKVMTILGEQGAAKLLEYLRSAPRIGGISVPGSLGLDLRFARRTVGTAGAEQVLLLADRPIGQAEAFNRSRSMDYPFTLVELKLNSAGQGEGTITLAAKLGMDRFTKGLVLENIVDQPIRLSSVKRESK
jgi:hypothetical protein